MTPEDRTWLKALPLLLMSTVLFTAGAYMFFRAADNLASIASMTAGVLAFGAWVATAISDWYRGHPQAPISRIPPETPDAGEEEHGV